MPYRSLPGSVHTCCHRIEQYRSHSHVARDRGEKSDHNLWAPAAAVQSGPLLTLEDAADHWQAMLVMSNVWGFLHGPDRGCCPNKMACGGESRQ